MLALHGMAFYKMYVHSARIGFERKSNPTLLLFVCFYTSILNWMVLGQK